MEYYKPIRSEKKDKKFKVRIYIPSTQKDKIIHFGHTSYEDFTQHKDPSRKKNYLTRSAGIMSNRGLTKDDYTSPNFWSRRFLWDSKESYGKLPLPKSSSKRSTAKRSTGKRSTSKRSTGKRSTGKSSTGKR